MKILHVMPYLPSLESGGPVRDYNIIKCLTASNIHSDVVCNISRDYSQDYISRIEHDLQIQIHPTKYEDLSIFNKIKVITIDGMYPPIIYHNTPQHINAIRLILENDPPDILHVQHSVEAAPALYAAAEASFDGCKVITMHNVDYLNVLRQKQLNKNPLMRFAYSRAASGLKKHELSMLREFDHIFVVSGRDKEIYVSHGLDSDKIDVIPNGVDCDHFDPSRIPGSVKFDHPCIFFMGKLSYKPNTFGIFNYLTEVHPIVKKHIPQVKLYITGIGCPPWLKKELLKDNSVVLLGFVEDVRPYISGADVCIAPLQAGSGTRLKILEYMASGKPVVSTSIGSEGINVTNNKNILIEDDWEAFAHKVVEVLKNKQLSQYIGDNARALVEVEYDWKIIVENQVRVYYDLLS